MATLKFLYIKLGFVLQGKTKRPDILKYLLVGAVSWRRLAMHNGEQAPGRQQELAPTNDIEIPIHKVGWVLKDKTQRLFSG